MPNTIFKKISEIIKTDFKNTFTGGNVVLQDSSSKPVKLKKTGNFLCIQPDKKIVDCKNNFPFFDTAIAELCSVSDYIIIYPTSNSLFVFIIELKTTNPTGAIKQVRASFELGKYICGTAKRMLNYPKVDIQYRGLIFSSKTFKGTSKPNKTFSQDKNSELKFRHLQSGNIYELDNLIY